jgi:hypothetical protein
MIGDMRTPAHTKDCRVCGAPFKVRAGAAGATVNCPAHRGRKPATPKVKTWPAIECGRCGKVHTTLRCDRCGF